MQSMTFTSSQSMWVFLRNFGLPGDPTWTFREAKKRCKELELPQPVSGKMSVSQRKPIFRPPPKYFSLWWELMLVAEGGLGTGHIVGGVQLSSRPTGAHGGRENIEEPKRVVERTRPQNVGPQSREANGRVSRPQECTLTGQEQPFPYRRHRHTQWPGWGQASEPWPEGSPTSTCLPGSGKGPSCTQKPWKGGEGGKTEYTDGKTGPKDWVFGFTGRLFPQQLLQAWKGWFRSLGTSWSSLLGQQE